MSENNETGDFDQSHVERNIPIISGIEDSLWSQLAKSANMDNLGSNPLYLEAYVKSASDNFYVVCFSRVGFSDIYNITNLAVSEEGEIYKISLLKGIPYLTAYYFANSHSNETIDDKQSLQEIAQEYKSFVNFTDLKDSDLSAFYNILKIEDNEPEDRYIKKLIKFVKKWLNDLE